MADKKKVIRVTTPIGTAIFPKIQVAERWDEAQQKFFSCADGNMAGGVYSTTLSIPKDECVDLCAKVDAWAQEALAEVLADPKKVAAAKAKRKTLELTPPYLPELDKDNNETGNILFRFKTNASGMVGGKLKVFEPPYLCNAADPPVQLKTNQNMYSGSRIKVNFTPSNYCIASSLAVGLTLYLNGAQIIKLVKGGWTPDSLGFGAVEGADEIQDTAAVSAASGAPAADDGSTAASDF